MIVFRNRFARGAARLCFSTTLLLLIFTGQVPAQAINLTLLGNLNPFSGDDLYSDVWSEGNLAILGSYHAMGVSIIDVSNPSAPVLAGEYNVSTNGLSSSHMKDVQIKNRIGYFASDAGNGVHIVSLTNPASPQLLSRVDPAIGGHSNVHNLFVDFPYLYTADSRTPIVKVFNVSNPAAPVFVRNIVTTDGLFVHDITVISNRLYTSGFGGQTAIYNVSNIAIQPPVLLGIVPTGTGTHSSWVTADGKILASCSEHFARDLRLYDIQDPANPVLLTAINSENMGLDAITPHNPIIIGHFLFVSWYQAGVQVLDISDPAHPWHVGAFDTFPGGLYDGDSSCSTAVCFDGNWGVHATSLNRVFLSDMDGGLFVLDASSITNPPPSLRLSSPVVQEGDEGPTNMVFQVMLSKPSAVPITLDYTTTSNTNSSPTNALAGLDYISTNGTLIFQPGETSKWVSVTILADPSVLQPGPELPETLLLKLTNFNNVALGFRQSSGTIVDRPARARIILSANDVRLVFQTTTGQTYRVEWTDNLTDPVWWQAVSEATNLPGTGNAIEVLDPGGAIQSQRYYRVRTN